MRTGRTRATAIITRFITILGPTLLGADRCGALTCGNPPFDTHPSSGYVAVQLVLSYAGGCQYVCALPTVTLVPTVGIRGEGRNLVFGYSSHSVNCSASCVFPTLGIGVGVTEPGLSGGPLDQTSEPPPSACSNCASCFRLTGARVHFDSRTKGHSYDVTVSDIQQPSCPGYAGFTASGTGDSLNVTSVFDSVRFDIAHAIVAYREQRTYATGSSVTIRVSNIVYGRYGNYVGATSWDVSVIGDYGGECHFDVTPTVPTTWGRLKTTYR